MGKLIYLTIFLASLDPKYEEASNVSRRALLETEMMKKEMSQLKTKAERKVYDKTGLTPNDLAYAAYAYPLVAGKISSKPFRNFKYVSEEKYILRPEIEYDLWSKDYSIMLIIIKEF